MTAVEARIRGRMEGAAAATEILDLLPDPVVVVAGGGVVEWCNRAASELVGRPRQDLIGEPLAAVFAIVDAEGRNVAGSTPVGRRLPIVKGLPDREYELQLPDGRFIPVSVRCSYEKDERDVVRRAVCVISDIRARRGMDMRTVELISTVSHEIRSPLTSVKGFTKTLLDRWERFDDDMKREMLGAVNADADRVKRLLDELLDISRLEAGRLRLRPQRIDLREQAERIAGKLGSRSERHTIEVRFTKAVPVVFADPDKIEQVLTNLVENALKYTEGGTVRIAGKVSGKRVSVSVSDEGEGIPSMQVPRLFRKFTRRERAGSPSGTGLGLYISRGLIEAHGGELSATSEVGKGSTFTFLLPIHTDLP